MTGHSVLASPRLAPPPEEPPMLRSMSSVGSFPRMPMTPQSPGSPSAFFLHTATTNIVVLAPPSPTDSSASRSATIASAASCSACKTARRWLQMNVVQRVLSALVLVPLITIFLWLSPAFATATFCTFVTSICSYEYAWLQHRIYLRIMTKMNACEPGLMRRDAGTNHVTAHSHEDGDSNRLSDSFSRSTRSESGSSREDDDVSSNMPGNVHANRGRTAGSTSGETVQSSPLSPPQPPRATLVTPELEDSPRFRHPPSPGSNATEDEAYVYDPSFSRYALSPIADRFFGQNEWLAALVLSAFTTVFTTTVFLIYVNHIPELQEKQLFKLRWFYSIATDFVAALCALFTPNWRYAFICLVEKAVFTLLTMHSTACPINRFRCGVSLEPAQVFLSGVVVIVFFRLQTRTSGPATFLHIALDMLGYLYIIGSLSVIVAFVDDERLESYRKLLIALLYVVWASDTGAYLTGKLLERIHYRYYNPLASHLSKNKDYEGTMGAILFGITAMFISSDMLNVPGSPIAQVGFTVLAVVVGRLGDLFESLLKRAAGVKDSGKLIPGHGGVLDRIDALMFASLVFARYYASIVM
ncbi:hypothetical protein V7S43_013503 [Phytophthora oleae]|uniref:Phosphatidate cytidylyltransferase n=1 Tax=Phytophthora oleae TaxID=2107226 RepID=A0ABD3F3K1_9STRA